MNRTISVSTDVYAGIWAQRQDGEETEDAVLRRLLRIKPGTGLAASSAHANSGGGVHDTRNDVHFPEGFVAFRSYKGKEYRATATNGAWIREDSGQRFPTLNQVNASIAAGTENIWNGNWKHRDAQGKTRSIASLRR
jgi:hypothetical protein